jgi:toxin YoeB
LKLLWTAKGWDEYVFWLQADPEMTRKINVLLRDIRRDPFRGLGKPEPLKGNFKGWWSRRITEEHRLVYRVQGTASNRHVEITQCRWHYERRSS